MVGTVPGGRAVPLGNTGAVARPEAGSIAAHSHRRAFEFGHKGRGPGSVEITDRGGFYTRPAR